MDLFVYQDVDRFESGKAITGYRSATWVERFAVPGEFKIEAPLSSGLRQLLPVDSVIGKVQSMDLMIVENVEITEDPEEEPMITISGRTYISFMEHRYSGFANATFVAGQQYIAMEKADTLYYAGVNDTYKRLWYLIRSCIDASVDPGNDISFVDVIEDMPTSTDGTSYTLYAADNLLKLVVEQLASWGIGIKTVRKNKFPGVIGDEANTEVQIHIGTDKTATVKFIPQTGDIESANYLFTNKNKKTSVLVEGRWVSVMYHGDGGETGFYRRVAKIDGSSIDDQYDTALTSASGAWNQVVERMIALGKSYLDRSNQILLVSANISENNRYRFRIDYDIGDIVTLDTPYGEALTMRVTEFAEVEDENGETGYPTLSVYVPPVNE